MVIRFFYKKIQEPHRKKMFFLNFFRLELLEDN